MKYKILILMIALCCGFSACGETPIFTEMSSNRLKIVLKGTLESEGKGNMSPLLYSPGDAAYAAAIEDDSVIELRKTNTVSTENDKSPTAIMFDIAEIRLGGEKISTKRQVFTIPLDDDHPFFNGTGIELVTDDPGSGNYDSVQLYLRKVVFDNAKIYRLSSEGPKFDEDAKVLFHEKWINGFDFNKLMIRSYWDSLRIEGSDAIRVFPMNISIPGGMTYSRLNGETVLEIRLVVRNFIEKFENVYYSSDQNIYKILHYYAFSDYLRDVRFGETYIGRNIHGVARSYIPGRTGSITVNNPTGGYILAVPSGEDISLFGLSDTGVNLRNALGNSDLPVAPTSYGAYIEPTLDYFLKYEEYKLDWNAQVAGLTLEMYTTAWDAYERAVHGDPDGVYNFGLKIFPHAAYSSAGVSVTFNNMAPGLYKFYRTNTPPYGSLFLNSDFAALNGGDDVNISEGENPGF